MSRILWAVLCVVLVGRALPADGATLRQRITTALASLNNKTQSEQLRLVNTWVNGVIERREARASFETTGNIPRLADVLEQHGDDGGTVPSGTWGYVALKCGILLQVDGIVHSHLAWAQVMDPGDQNPRALVLYDDDETTWVLDSLRDDPYELGSTALVYPEYAIYRCDNNVNVRPRVRR